MHSVSNNYKTAVRGSARMVKASITHGADVITDSDDLKSLEIIIDGDFCRTVMRQVKFEYFESHDYLDEYVNIQVGTLVSGTPEYVNHGDFKVVEVKENKASGVRSVVGYDRMYESLLPYDLEPEYPTTMKGLLEDICTELGWTLATQTFVNDDLPVTRELFSASRMSYRDVLNMIAEASGTIIFFNEDGELELKTVGGASLETLTSDDLVSLKLEPMWGELNSLVLSRQPQEDNIVEKDDESIAEYGLNEFKIVNNYILDDFRETYITPIFNSLKGLKFYPFKADTIGLGYYEVGDKIKVKDLNDDEFDVVITKINLKVTGALKEVIECKIPEKTSTNYDHAGIIGKKITNTEIIVNKQEGEIKAVVEEVKTKPTVYKQATEPEGAGENDLWLNTSESVIYYYDGENWIMTSIDPSTLDNYYTKTESDSNLEITADQITSFVVQANSRIDEQGGQIGEVTSQMSEISQRMNEISVLVQGVGGSNLLKNSTGLKGNITEWQEFDEEGDLIDEDNDGEVIQDTDIRSHSESGSGIKMVNQYVLQKTDVIIGGVYTIYFRFKKNDIASLFINDEEVAIEVDDYVDDEWAIFNYQFTAGGNEVVIKFDNTEADEQSYILVSDVVLKLGDCNGWTPAPNEAYGKNYRLDKEGLSISSETSGFSSLLNDVQFSIKDSSSDKNILYVDKDSSFLTKLTVQDELVIQRYGNPDKSTRIIPTDTGSMLVVND